MPASGRFYNHKTPCILRIEALSDMYWTLIVRPTLVWLAPCGWLDTQTAESAQPWMLSRELLSRPLTYGQIATSMTPP